MNRPIRSFQEAERLAKRRLPKAIYDTIASGAGQEITLRDNLQAFQEVGFRPRAAVQHSNYDLNTSVLGHEISLPVMIAPTGSMRMFHTSAEPAVAKAAGRAGTLQVVSCFMGYPVEEVVEAAQGPVFFDLYFAGGRDNVEVMLDRARKAGCQALVITVDMTGGHASERGGQQRATPLLGLNWRTAVRFAPQLVTKPAWTFDFIRDGMRLDCPMWMKPNGRAASFGEMSTSILREWPTWKDLGWIREHWDRPIVVKGILCPEDAVRAIDEGVDAIVVSNHGGHNVDGSPATLRVLPEIVETVDERVEVYLDGGIRRGSDVVKALALGARAVLIGRANVYAHAAAGERGVVEMLEVLRTGMEQTLRSLGCPSVQALDRSCVEVPATWQDRSVARARDVRSERGAVP